MSEIMNHRPIEVITGEIKFYANQAGVSIIEIGKRLHEAKLCLPHGEWGNWLKNEVKFSERTAQNFMRIARDYPNPQLVADLGNSVTKALLALSVPAEEREDFISVVHEVNGEAKTVAEMTSREMEQLIKELETERAEKEKLRSQLDLFQTEAEKEKDDAVDAAYKENEDKLAALISQKEAAEQARREAEAKIASMETEMDELKLKAEQTVLPDESELERLRQEAEAAAQKKTEESMQKKLDKAKADAEKARKEATEAQAAIEAHEAAQKEAEENALKMKEELEQVRADAERKLKTAGSTSAAEFKVHLQAVQNGLDEMLACIAKAEENGEADTAEKMKNLMKALCQNVQNNL